MENTGLLLHVCCAPCAAGCLDSLILAGRRVVLYYSNSNIATREEFERRLASVQELARIYALPLEVDPYDHGAWLKRVVGLEQEPEKGGRCRVCFYFSLERSAHRAAELGVGFTTTLTVSPHKSSQTIFEVGSVWSHFEPWNFKKQDGFKHGRELAREYGFYLQNFCGCEFSYR